VQDGAIVYGRFLLGITGLCLLCLGAFSCDKLPAPATPAAPPAARPGPGELFNPAVVGAVSGRVTWPGQVPVVPPFRSLPSPLSAAGGRKQSWPNPNVPVIDAGSRGVAGAVVFLRGVDPRRARGWDHPPVRVVQRGHRFHVMQGEIDRHNGFVRRGDAVQMVSEGEVFHALLARGAAFFARTFPDPGRPCRQRLNRPGVVELSSGAGYFWMRAYLFVDDHPYYTRTDSACSFSLAQVPPGSYEVVCWVPDWREQAHELDGDTGRVWRLTFRPALVRTRPVLVEPGRVAAVDVELSEAPGP
jgi:hypothetical protein